ncbi:hypothetical protein BgiMline_027735 [Biomphalaria glabrata]|nr:hypothetical protein; partial [Biomphalaria glabrata]
MSNYCDACTKARKRLSAENFLEWRKDHKNCQRNHEGPSGQMEPSGMLAIFNRSAIHNGLKYVNYLGDGDSKSFKTVAEATPPVYDSIEIKKLECCGHIQKRMDKKLMDKVAECKGKVYEENGKKYKGIGNAGRLTTRAIKRIQGHYGGAIRKNFSAVSKMKRVSWRFGNIGVAFMKTVVNGVLKI